MADGEGHGELCALKSCGFADFTASRVTQRKCKSRLNPNQYWNRARTPPAALACAWPMIFIPFHTQYLHTGMWGNSRHSQTGGCWETLPWISSQIPTQIGIHPCHSRLLWRHSTFCALAVPASTWEEHTSPQTGQEVRGRKLREVEPSEGRGKFTKWIERKSTRPGKEKERE